MSMRLGELEIIAEGKHRFFAATLPLEAEEDVEPCIQAAAAAISKGEGWSKGASVRYTHVTFGSLEHPAVFFCMPIPPEVRDPFSHPLKDEAAALLSAVKAAVLQH
jgi:hypothetical protein